MNAIKRFINIIKSPLIPIRLFVENEETTTTTTTTTSSDPVTEAMKGAKKNSENAMLGTGGTSLSNDPEGENIVSEYDKATAENDEEKKRAAELKLKGLEKEKQDNQESTPAEVERAANDLSNTKVSHIDLGSEDAKKQAIKSTNDVADIVSKATDEELKSYLSHVDEDLQATDITTEQGRKNAESYINELSSILNNSKAYEQLTKDYKKAQFLTAISGGLSAAFGVPAIDFTKKPSIQVAKEQLDEARKYLNDIRANSNKRKQEQLDTEKQKATTKIAAKEKAASEVAKMDQADYNTKRSAETLTNANLEGQKAQEQYLLDKGTNVNKEIGAQSDYQKNWKGLSSRLWNFGENVANTAVNAAIKH